jgi:tetratricopeptide (TPR) repeat protein
MTLARRWTFFEFIAFAFIPLFVSGCEQPKRELVPVSVSGAADLEPSVRTALTRARAEFESVANNKPTDAQLADAYGELAMMYHAHNLVPPAEAAYSNARVLAPRDKRWPYLLGHLYNDSSKVAEAIVAFEAALALDASDAPTLYSLGEVYLQHGDFDKAQKMYLQLQSNAGMRAAALTGLGKVALAKREYKEAVGYLEEALKLSPGSTRLRQPLAMAYRGLGDRVNAEQNLRQYTANGAEPGVVDPLADALGAKVAASRSLLRRGQRFGNAGRFDLAEPAFRAAVQADPSNAEAIANLGISLANLGRIDEAQQRLTESLALDDTSVFAHLNFGVILDRQGLDQRAIAQYSEALSRDPTNLQARVYLADVKMRLGLAEDAIKLYRTAADQMPDSSRMQLSLAMANIKAGHYNEARKVLEAALQAKPANPEIINALARLLATAPEGALRDGTRALALAKSLFESTKSPDIGQTYAMALAETGDFDHAVLLQRETIIVFERTGRAAEKPFLQRNLARYEQHKPTREGWAADDPMFQPRSPAARLAKSP